MESNHTPEPLLWDQSLLIYKPVFNHIYKKQSLYYCFYSQNVVATESDMGKNSCKSFYLTQPTWERLWNEFWIDIFYE